MEEPKKTDPTFKKGADRKRIAIGTAAVVVAVVVVAAVVVVVVLTNKKEDVYDLAKFVYVQSSGLTSDGINVTVRYEANENCNHTWIFGHMLSDRWTYEVGSKHKIGNRLFETSVLVADSNITGVFLRVYCMQKLSIMGFDLSALQQAGVQENIPDMSIYTFTLGSIEKDPSTNDYKLRLRMNSPVNITDGTVELGVYLNGLNTSTPLNNVFENGSFYIPLGFNESLRINELPLDNGVAQGEIVVPYRFAKYGGILTAGLTKRVKDGLVRYLNLGIHVYLETSETNTVIPSGRFGMYRRPEDSRKLGIYKDSLSFICFVMGNPVPNVDIILTYPNGSVANFEPFELQRDLYMYFDVATVRKSQFRNGGKFTCRASKDGKTQTREVEFEFRDPQYCKVDVTQTGVVSQSNENDIVRCTVTGDPRPELEITLYRYSGPDLMRTGIFQTSVTALDDKTTTANLTITPPNQYIHTVFCVCKQYVYFRSSRPADQYQSIVLYPGRHDNNGFLDRMWRLYANPLV